MSRHRIFRIFAVTGISATVLGGALAAMAFQRQNLGAGKGGAENGGSVASKVFVSSNRPASLSPVSRPVRVFVVGSSTLDSQRNTFTGTVRARYETAIAFRVSGKIWKRHVEVGQRVSVGDLLFELDPKDFELQQKSAQANLTVANASVLQSTAEEKRLRELRSADAISQSEYDLALSARDIAMGQLASAEKQLELANNQLAYCRIVSDVDGIVMAITAEAGQVVTAGMKVCDIAHGNELEAVVDIPEKPCDSPRRRNDQCSILVVARCDAPRQVARSFSVADAVTRTYRCRFSLLDPPRDVKLGMTATVLWSNAQESTKFSIPATAVYRQGGQPAVWLIDPESGSISLTPIQISVFGENDVVVTSGLTRGQSIVSAGVQKLDASIKVRTWEVQK